MLFRGKADLLKRLKPRKRFVSPCPCELTRHPGVCRLTDKKESPRGIFQLEYHLYVVTLAFARRPFFRAVFRASSIIGPGKRRQPARALSKASTKWSTSFSVIVSGGKILMTSILWPATWVRTWYRLSNGTMTSCAKRP